MSILQNYNNKYEYIQRISIYNTRPNKSDF